MVVITKTKLISFYELEPISKTALIKWYKTVLASDWVDFHSIKKLSTVWTALETTALFLIFLVINTELWQ